MATTLPRPRRRDELPADLAGGAVAAGGLAVIAAVPLIGRGLLALLHADAAVPAGRYLLQWSLVTATYLVAGVAAGLAFWALRPLRRRWIGWGMTGGLVAALVYGAFCLLILSLPADLGGDPRSRARATDFLWEGVPLLALLGFCFGAWKYRSRDELRF